MDPSDPKKLTVLYEQVVSSIDELISGLEGADFEADTDLEHWTVRDALAHLSAFEMIASRAVPHASETDVSHLPHATGFNETVEKDIEFRRHWPVERVVEEFRSGTVKRLEQLRAWGDSDWNGTTLTPFGEMPSRNIMPIRIIDLHYHEQDMRRAVGVPGGLDGEVARFVAGRVGQALPKIVGKDGGGQPGQSVVINLTSHAGRTISVVVGVDGKAAFADTPPAEPTLRLTCDLETYLMLHGGRRAWETLEREGRLTVTGDRDLAARVLPAMAVTP